MLHLRMKREEEERGEKEQPIKTSLSGLEPFHSNTQKFSCGGRNKCNNERSQVEFSRISSYI